MSSDDGGLAVFGLAVLFGILLLPFIGMGALLAIVLLSFTMRCILGFIGDLFGATPTVGRWVLGAYIAAPLVVALSLAGAPGGLPAALVILGGVTPVYWWAFTQNKLPFSETPLDVPFKSDAVAHAEALQLAANVAVEVGLAEARVRLAGMEVVEALTAPEGVESHGQSSPTR